MEASGHLSFNRGPCDQWQAKIGGDYAKAARRGQRKAVTVQAARGLVGAYRSAGRRIKHAARHVGIKATNTQGALQGRDDLCRQVSITWRTKPDRGTRGDDGPADFGPATGILIRRRDVWDGVRDRFDDGGRCVGRPAGIVGPGWPTAGSYFGTEISISRRVRSGRAIARRNGQTQHQKERPANHLVLSHSPPQWCCLFRSGSVT